MSKPTPVTESSMMIPPVDVIYEDAQTGELMSMRVRTTIKDRSAYEVHAHKNGWPTDKPMTSATFLWSGFIAWSALRRSPDAPAQLRTPSPDAFFDAVLEVMPVDEEEEADVVNPTQPAQSPEHD